MVTADVVVVCFVVVVVLAVSLVVVLVVVTALEDSSSEESVSEESTSKDSVSEDSFEESVSLIDETELVSFSVSELSFTLPHDTTTSASAEIRMSFTTFFI